MVSIPLGFKYLVQQRIYIPTTTISLVSIPLGVKYLVQPPAYKSFCRSILQAQNRGSGKTRSSLSISYRKPENSLGDKSRFCFHFLSTERLPED